MTYLVPVTFPEGSPFRAVWGASAELPVVRDRPERVAIPGQPVREPWCWLIDLKDDRVSPAQLDRLILALAERWGVPPGEIAAQIFESGSVPIMACSCWNTWAPERCADGTCRWRAR